VIKPAYSLSFLLSVNIFVWQNDLNFPKILRIFIQVNRLLEDKCNLLNVQDVSLVCVSKTSYQPEVPGSQFSGCPPVLIQDIECNIFRLYACEYHCNCEQADDLFSGYTVIITKRNLIKFNWGTMIIINEKGLLFLTAT